MTDDDEDQTQDAGNGGDEDAGPASTPDEVEGKDQAEG